jgi:hypothetical protein
MSPAQPEVVSEFHDKAEYISMSSAEILSL